MTTRASKWASPHVLWDELSCRDRLATPYPIDYRKTRLPRVLAAFKAIREIWNREIRITSAYRTSLHNRAIGGAANSQHVQGLALDIEPPDGVTPEDAYRRIVALTDARPDLGIHYICGYAVSASKPRGQIHVDCRETPAGHEWVAA